MTFITVIQPLTKEQLIVTTGLMESRKESECTLEKYNPKETQSFGQGIIQNWDENGDLMSNTVNNGISVNGQENKNNTENIQQNSHPIQHEHILAQGGEKDGMVDWKLPLGEFMSKKRGAEEKGELLSKNLRSFYKSQDKMIDAYKELQEPNDLDDAMENVTHLRKNVSIYSKLTFLANVVLLIIKITAVILSGSISLICSLVDSSVDLISGLIIYTANRAVKRRKPYSYPQGRTRLEPIAIIILSVMMAITSLELIKESVSKIIGFINKTQTPPKMDFITIGISSATVAFKLVLHLLCRRIHHPTIQALAQDHLNDVMSNSVAILFGYIGSSEMQEKVGVYELVYIDPAGAILISLYIAVNWWNTGYLQIRMLTGYTADPQFLSRLTWISLNHHKEIRYVDTVRAFHFGNHFLVEVDIVLPEDMTVCVSHDIGEELQQKLERLQDVERAFVHIDYETTHKPHAEHKML